MWYFRSAWNVAALNCTGPAYQPILDGYGAFIKANDKALRQVNSRIDASYRKDYPVARDAIKAREKTMTTVYKLLHPARRWRANFCQAALGIVNQASGDPQIRPDRLLDGTTSTRSRRRFDTFFGAYEQYQRDSAAWGRAIRAALRRIAAGLSGGAGVQAHDHDSSGRGERSHHHDRRQGSGFGRGDRSGHRGRRSP